jgi:hypothetical protein
MSVYIGVHWCIPQEYGDRQQKKGRFRLVLKDIQAKEYSALANLTPKVLFCSCVRACVRHMNTLTRDIHALSLSLYVYLISREREREGEREEGEEIGREGERTITCPPEVSTEGLVNKEFGTNQMRRNALTYQCVGCICITEGESELYIYGCSEVEVSSFYMH